MPGVGEDLIRDASSLHRFITSIYKHRDEPEKSHREATIEFLKYIRDLGDKAQKYLQFFVQQATDTPFDPDIGLQFDRQGLTTIREFWSNLHDFVRPIEDAHTLNIPVALIELLEKRLSKIPPLADSRIVISHTSELNYIQFPRTDLRYAAQEYAAIVPGSPSFPQKLALIAMPYSQATSLFLNLVICHELGHYAFEELQLKPKLAAEIRAALKDSLPNYNTRSEPDLSWCQERMEYWSEEIFCDRFAIGLIGPVYSFAYTELFDIVGTSEQGDVGEFNDTHPSDACRYKEHTEQLTAGGWWNLLDETPRTSYVDLLKKLAAMSESDYFYDSEQKPELAEPTLRAFLSMKPKIGPLVMEAFGTTLRRFGGAVESHEIQLIKKYLSRGVVPSTLIRKEQPIPDPVALLTAAYLFHLESLPELMQRIARQDDQNLDQRARWSERIEMWTLKALEDVSLLASQETST